MDNNIKAYNELYLDDDEDIDYEDYWRAATWILGEAYLY
jgi:hypothetical protein